MRISQQMKGRLRRKRNRRLMQPSLLGHRMYFQRNEINLNAASSLFVSASPSPANQSQSGVVADFETRLVCHPRAEILSFLFFQSSLAMGNQNSRASQAGGMPRSTGSLPRGSSSQAQYNAQGGAAQPETDQWGRTLAYLLPITKKELSKANDERLAFGTGSMQGWRDST